MSSDTGQVTLSDVVNSASDMLAAVEDGTLRAGDVQDRAIAVCKQMFGIVGSGPSDPLWPLHLDIARQVQERGGLTAAELREWTAVQSGRDGLPKT